MTVDNSDYPPEEWLEPEGDPAAELEALEQHRRSFERLARTAPTRVVIQLQPEVKVGGYADDLERRLPEEAQQAWYELFPETNEPAEYKPTIRRLFRDVEGGDDRLLPELLTYYEVRLPRDREEALAVAERVERLGNLDHIFRRVYTEGPPAPLPQAPCGGRVRNFMAAAPNGMNVNSFRPTAGGAWPRVVDMEWVWNQPQAHSDLGLVNALAGFEGPTAAQYGVDYAEDNRHATAVLGILAASGGPGGPGCPGMLPGPSVKFASAWLPDPDWHDNVAARIKSVTDPANGHMGAGDILLLELQAWGRHRYFSPETQAWEERVVLGPVELEGHIGDAIRQATQVWGIVVIEAAGNGAEVPKVGEGSNAALGVDLMEIDNLSHLSYSHSQESGAILVAACGAFLSTLHKPWKLSNFGDRVTCYAYGQNVHTLDINNPAGMWPFGNTSAASALVAGVAALVQNAALRDLGRRLTVDEMRKALTCSTQNPLPAAGNKIGVMPDMTAVVGTYLTTL